MRLSVWKDGSLFWNYGSSVSCYLRPCSLVSASKYLFQLETFTFSVLWGCKLVLLALGNRKNLTETCSIAVTNSWDTFSINQALTHPSLQHLNASQRKEQKQLLLNSQFETSDVAYPSHLQIGSGS